MKPRAWAARLAAALLLWGMAAAPAPRGLVPPIVFVSRKPPDHSSAGLKEGPEAWRAIPGFGPRGRAVAEGGRLMVRGWDARVRPLLPEGAFFDVSDPSVSWDGRRIAFAATVHPDSAWRIWVMGRDGRGLTPITRTNRSLDLSPLGAEAFLFERYDDLDPCWLPDGRLCFASTRFPLVSEGDHEPASNLFVVRVDGSGLERISSDRNGAEEPSVDPRDGRVVYARWWFNRYRASDRDRSGLTTDFARALPADTVNLWHAVSIRPDGDLIRLAGGDARRRESQQAYQPIVLRDGTLVGVRAAVSALVPASGPTSLQAFPGGIAEARVLTGVGNTAGSSACSPAALPDGRVLFSLAPGPQGTQGRNDFGLWIVETDGSGLTPVLDLHDTDDLDAAVLAARPRPPIITVTQLPEPPALPTTHLESINDIDSDFRFDCLNVFANGKVDAPIPDAVPIQRGVKIRFFASLWRPASAGGDTAVLVKEEPLSDAVAVHEERMYSDIPLFEQLVDSKGRVLRSASGPAHVPGFNYSRAGAGSKCVGCHAGHSAIEVAPSAAAARFINVSTAAEATASSSAPGSVGPRGAVDRRTIGQAERVAWVSETPNDEWLRLTWKWPIEADQLVLYAIRRNASMGTDLRVQACEIRFFNEGRQVRDTVVARELSPEGTRVLFRLVRVDAIEIRPVRVSGNVGHHPAVALAEVETFARLTTE